MVIPIQFGLSPNIPSLETLQITLSLIRAGELRDFGPALSSVRAFAREIGVAESTLRTAFLTEGRRPSLGTLARVDEGIRRNYERILGRTVSDTTVIDRHIGRNPLAQAYLRAPLNRTGVRLWVSTQDRDYKGFRTYKFDDPDIDLEDALAVLGEDEVLETIVYRLD
jgi:hypothetical protein